MRNGVGDRTLDAIADLAARRFDASLAFVLLLHEPDAPPVTAGGTAIRMVAADDPVWMPVLRSGGDGPAVLDALRTDARRTAPPCADRITFGFAAAAPLTAADGHRFGALIVADRAPRASLTVAEHQDLAGFAAVAARHIESVRSLILGGLGEARWVDGPRRAADGEIGLPISQVPCAVAVLDSRARYVAASRPWCDLFGTTAAAVIGSDAHAGAAALPAVWHAGHLAALAGATPAAVEARLRGGDGADHRMRRHVRAWFDRNGDIAGIVLFLERLDEIRAKEEALARTVAFLETILETLHDGVVACDASGALTCSNAAARRIHGIDAEPVPPERWAARYDLYDTDGITPLALADNPLHRALAGETTEWREGVIAPAGRPPRSVVASARPMRDGDGRIVGAVATIRDLTGERTSEARRREAEARYRTLFDHAAQFSARLDRDGLVVEVNDCALALAGVGLHEVLHRPFWDGPWWRLGRSTPRRLRHAIRAARSGRFVRYETMVCGVDGHRLPIDFTLKPIVDDGGAVTGLIAEGRDITGERETRARLELVSNSLPFLVSYIDRGLNHLFMNRTGARWFDRTPEDIVGRHVSTILDAATFDRLRPHFERALRGDTVTFEAHLDCPDGSVRDIEATCVPDIDETGDRRGFVSIVMDITDRKRAAAEIDRKTRELQLIFDHVPVLIFHKDDENRILRLNAAAARSMGVSVAEAEGGDTWDLFPAMAAKYHADDLAVIESGRPKLGIVEQYTPRDRPPTWIRTDKVPATDPVTGKRFVFIVASDITAEKLAEDALRRSEERYRRLYNETPVMQQSVDAGGRLVQVSDHWLEKLGHDREAVIGRLATDFLTPASRLRATSEIAWQFRMRGVSKDVEYQMVAKDGRIIDVLLSAVAERDADDRIVRSIEVMTDITDRKVMERQFAQAQKMETLGQLTGGLAHDFNNLLGVVLGNLQLVQRSVATEPRAARRVEAALGAVDRGAELTRRLLAFSRRQQLETESVAPNPLVAEVGEILRRTLGETIALDLCLADDLPPVETDPSQLQSALLNLAINARDAMPNGGRVTIRSRLHLAGIDPWDGGEALDGSVRVAISVTDTGRGIPAEHLDRVFEPFFTTKDVGRGSGLGLSMVYGFIRQSGGHVAIASTVGVGTVVTMLLPIAQLPPKPQAIAAPPVTVAANGARVLIVEDQVEVRDMAIALIEDLGYRTLSAASAAEALAIVESGAPIDLVFTDIVMPGGMLGTELAQRIARHRPGVPCIFTTGFAEAGLLAEGAASGRTNLVFKPYRRADLAEMFRTALDGVHTTAAATTTEGLP